MRPGVAYLMVTCLPALATCAPPRLQIAGSGSATRTVNCASLPVFLSSSDSEVLLLGARGSAYGEADATPIDGGRFRLTGPASEVLSVWVEPRVTCSIQRTGTTVDIAMHETVLHAEHRGVRKNLALIDVLSRAVFVPRSHLRVLEEDGGYRVTSDIDMSVTIDLPEVPRATVRVANAVGSAALRAVCARTTKQRIREIEKAYHEWVAAQQGTSR